MGVGEEGALAQRIDMAAAPVASRRAPALPGELLLTSELEERCPDVVFLHRRKLGRDRKHGDIDHIAIAPSGIYLIDAQRTPSKKVRVVRTGGLLTPIKERLTISGKDNSHLLEGCETQVAAVKLALADHPLRFAAEVIPLLCFIDASLPAVIRTKARGVRVLNPKVAVKMLNREGSLDSESREALLSHLNYKLPCA